MTHFSLFKTTHIKVALVSTLALAAGSALAQDNRVQLRSLDGAMSLEGAFIGFRDGVYVIDHDSLGTLRIEATDQIVCDGASCPGAEPEPEPEPEPALEEIIDLSVTLRTADGRLALEGDFVDFRDGAYIIDSASLGRLVIDQIPGLECLGAACPDLVPEVSKRTLTGSVQELASLLPALLDGYAASIGASVEVGAADSEGVVPVNLIGSNGATISEFLIATRSSDAPLTALAETTASFALMDRRVSETDLAQFASSAAPNPGTEMLVGHDALVIVANPMNAVRALTTSEISALWSGQVTNWLGFGGGNVDVAIGSALEHATDVALFDREVLAPNAGGSSAATQYSSAGELIGFVATNPGAIGILRRSEAEGSGLPMIDIEGSCGLLSRPTDFDIKNGGYVMAKDIYGYIRQEQAHPDLAAFAAWIDGPGGEEVVASVSYENAVPALMSVQDMGLNLAISPGIDPEFNGAQYVELMQNLFGAQRSSADFRFTPGSSNLDADSLDAIEYFAAQIDAGRLEGYNILLVGFSDSTGPFDINRDLAQARADTVQTQLIAALSGATNVQITTAAAGEFMPTACNATPEGRDRNRRVEAWLRLAQ